MFRAMDAYGRPVSGARIVRCLMVKIMARKAVASRPRLTPASVFVMMSLTQEDSLTLPLNGPAESVPGPPRFGLDSHTYSPSALKVFTQHLGSGSIGPKRAKKLRPTIVAMRIPAIMANVVVANG